MIQYSINSQDTQIDVWYDASSISKNYNNKLLFVKNSSQNFDIYKIETTGITKVQTLTGGPGYSKLYFRDPITLKEYLAISHNEAKVYLLNPASTTPATYYCDCPFFMESIYNDLVLGGGDVNNPLGNNTTFSVFDLVSKSLKTTANSLPSPYNTAHTAGRLRYEVISNSDLIILRAFDSNDNETSIGVAKINRSTFTASILYSNNELLTNKVDDGYNILSSNKLYIRMKNYKIIRFTYNGTTLVKDLLFSESIGLSSIMVPYGNDGIIVVMGGGTFDFGIIYNNSTIVTPIEKGNISYDSDQGILYHKTAGKLYKKLNEPNFAIGPIYDNSSHDGYFPIYLDDNHIFTVNFFSPVYLTSYTAGELTYNLTVNTIPADASFYIRVGAALSLQDKSKPIPLPPGEYYTNTIAKTDDYKDDVRTINITQDMTLDITLLRRPWVEFKITPSDAVVMFNDAGTWVQGTKFRCLEGLTYEYTVSKTGFDTQIGTVVVGTEDIVRNITLISNVRIDKEKRFPGTFKLLDITKPEYITEKGSVVIAGADKLVNIILKAANVYKVTFSLTPSNAVVELLSKGSILTGTSFDLTPGSYTYQIKCDGYISKSGTVTVIGEAKTITETLVEAIYQVSFTTTPAAAIVQVYYNNTWNNGKTHNLKKGSYQYRVTATDYTDKTGTIEVVNANVTTNVVLSSDGGVVTITNWTPTDAMSQMSPITEMFRLGKGLLPENNRLTYTLPKDKYQLKITSNQPQKYLPYYNKFELTGDKTINPVFRENAIDWSTMAPYLEDKLGGYYYDQPDRQSNRVLINSNQIIFDDGYRLIRLLKSGSKFIYQRITDTSVTNPNVSSVFMRTSIGNEVFAVKCGTETFINKALSANISNIGKVNNLNPLYISDNGMYVVGIRQDGTARKLSVLTTNPFTTRPEITLNIGEGDWVEGKCSDDGAIVVLTVRNYDTKENTNLLYKYNSGVYQQITLPNTVFYTEINAIGLINSTHIGLQSSELSSSISGTRFYDLFKIDGMTLTRLTGNNSTWTSNGVPMYRIHDIRVVISTPTGLICYGHPIIGIGHIDFSYNSLVPSGTGYNMKYTPLYYTSNYSYIEYSTYSTPRYNKAKQAIYISLVYNLSSLAKEHSVINSPLLIFNKLFEIDKYQNIYPDILSKDIYQDVSRNNHEELIAVSTDGNLVLTQRDPYEKLKTLKLYDLTNNSVSEYIP